MSFSEIREDVLVSSGWALDCGVRMLVANDALADWCGDRDLPREEKERLARQTGHRRYSHYGFADDVAGWTGVDTMRFRGHVALLFGYEACASRWIPAPSGGTLVQIKVHCSYGRIVTLDTLRAVAAGAADVAYESAGGAYFDVDQP